MAKLSPREIAEKHARRLKASIADIQAGLDRVTESPGKKAAAQVEKMKRKLVEKIDDGTWARRTAATDLGKWKETTKRKVSANLAAGIDAVVDEQTEFYEELTRYQDSIKPIIDRMPDATIEDSANRAAEWVRQMGKFRRK